MRGYEFRKMLDSSTYGQLWPTGVAIVLGRETALKKEVRDALLSTHWDLTIVDEVHHFRGPKATELLRGIGESSERIVISGLPGQELPNVFPADAVHPIEWRSELVRNYDGGPLGRTPRPVLHEMHFSLSDAESMRSDEVEKLSRMLEEGSGRLNLVESSLRSSSQSSPAALEARLQMLASIPSHAAEHTEPLREDTEYESLDGEPKGSLAFTVTAEARSLVSGLLGSLEAAERDSKLAAFGDLLNRLVVPSRPKTKICVMTIYLATLFYVAAEIEMLGHAYWVIHGSMDAEERQNVLKMFSSGGGIIVATQAVLSEGFDLAEVTHLILYDIPQTSPSMEQVVGRFDRIGRQSQLNIHVLSPSSDLRSEPILLLRNVLASI